MGQQRQNQMDEGLETLVRPVPKLSKPPMYRVILHNDDYTTRDFVVLVLREIFQLSEVEAVRTMLEVHHKGAGVAGTYTREIAEMKVHTVERMAREQEFPLRLSMQPEEVSK